MPRRRISRFAAFPRFVSPRSAALVAAALPVAALALMPTATAQAAAQDQQPGRCPPSAVAVHYSDGLDKVQRDGATVGGLSSLAYDSRTSRWASAVDNDGTEPERIWFFRSLTDPTLVGKPLILRHRNGVPYTGVTADDEGLAILPGGRYVISSETEPSIRIFGRDGREQASLPVPTRFRVTPGGQATDNATLEGLTLTPSGNRLIAAMEGTLSGDTGDGTYRRFLIYDRTAPHAFTLTRQIGYRVQAGFRVPEVAAYGESSMLVEEAAYDPATGNSVNLYAVTGLGSARDVSRVANLAHAPAGDIVHKRLVADLVRCPTLGAPALEPQANPLLDNFEGMAITTPRLHGVGGVSLIADDNFSDGQHTRLLDLLVRLP